MLQAFDCFALFQFKFIFVRLHTCVVFLFNSFESKWICIKLISYCSVQTLSPVSTHLFFIYFVRYV